MDFNEFTSQMEQDVRAALEYVSPGVRLRQEQISKLQGESYTALSVAPSDGNVGVNINLTQLYERMEAGVPYDALSMQDQSAAEKLLLALIDFLRTEAPTEEQNYPSLLEILTSMKNLPYGEKDAVDCLMEDYKKHRSEEPEYFHEYCGFKQMVDDKDAVIHVCIVAVAAIVQELYGEIVTAPAIPEP